VSNLQNYKITRCIKIVRLTDTVAIASQQTSTQDEARVELALNLEHDFVTANYACDAELDFAVKHYVM